ncbi:VTC domain [Corynebacterium kutscheri]|uniref:VTC domain n=1 Tax=Corynebacterium kutscheri TaxID=35755 RepID=A0A0F6QYW9_9CORY|nr:polyphosphate polymerase domain-containing protein [Corynebacterium kutscheri]AKE40370.1 VTC domain-containing protein [Corynebacterium kutscheri]VEH05341.1 VTC domain [Corynebacterium kutscheri]VEH10764.1 VTC domain [Corynebacterium kutscheri]VEH80756.1 VTC domain [Corynebacterium kutscheri]
MSTAIITDDLKPISLDELIAQAAMLTRVDRKYVLRRDDVQRVINGLNPATRVLILNGQAPQAYRSTYFDTPDLRSFYLAAHPRRHKFKVRTRTYVDSEIAFLEVKAKGARGVTIKERIPYDFEAAMHDVLIDDVRPWLEERLVAAGQPTGTGAHLQPTMWGSYKRTTLLMADGAGRATFDTELDWANAHNQYLARPDMVIFETKSGSRPSELDRLLWANGHRPAKISKFGTGMAALDSALPHNRWHKVLNHHFYN